MRPGNFWEKAIYLSRAGPTLASFDTDGRLLGDSSPARKTFRWDWPRRGLRGVRILPAQDRLVSFEIAPFHVRNIWERKRNNRQPSRIFAG